MPAVAPHRYSRESRHPTSPMSALRLQVSRQRGYPNGTTTASNRCCQYRRGGLSCRPWRRGDQDCRPYRRGGTGCCQYRQGGQPLGMRTRALPPPSRSEIDMQRVAPTAQGTPAVSTADLPPPAVWPHSMPAPPPPSPAVHPLPRQARPNPGLLVRGPAHERHAGRGGLGPLPPRRHPPTSPETRPPTAAARPTRRPPFLLGRFLFGMGRARRRRRASAEERKVRAPRACVDGRLRAGWRWARGASRRLVWRSWVKRGGG
eukprot:scaffold5295_cov85-Isochrysis_galbana.AAC.5